MNQNSIKILTKKNISIVYLILAAFMLIGTFFDFQINTVLYHSKSFLAVAVAHYGLYPAVPVTFVTAAIFLKLILADKKDYISMICLLWNIYMITKTVKEYWKLFASDTGASKWIQFVLGLVLAAALAGYVFWKADVSLAKQVRRMAMIILFTFSIQYLLINNVIKTPWGRPRFRSVIVTDGLDFRAWYLPGLTAKAKELMAAGMKAGEFKSFPSGHAGCAATFITLVYLTKFVPAFQKQEKLFTVIGFLWIGLTILGRMVAGAHYLTDVTFATLITWTAFVLLSKVLPVTFQQKEDV